VKRIDDNNTAVFGPKSGYSPDLFNKDVSMTEVRANFLGDMLAPGSKVPLPIKEWQTWKGDFHFDLAKSSMKGYYTQIWC
jgi:hypothetical protein